MSESSIPMLRRLSLALYTFWRILVDAPFAAGIAELRKLASSGAPMPGSLGLREAEPNAALQLLGLLQRDGRFVDFLQENVTAYSDTEVGAAARVVHEGCRKTLKQYFTIEAVRSEPEGARITLEEGFDAAAVRLAGNVVGRPPFSGGLVHRGWQVTESRLPQVASGHDLSILAPAEVEL